MFGTLATSSRSTAARSTRLSLQRGLAQSVRWDEDNVAHSILPEIDLKMAREVRFSEFIMKDFEKFGDRMAILDAVTGDERTFTDLSLDVTKIGRGLRDGFGIKAKDVVALMSVNHVDYFSTLHGVNRLGAAVTPANPVYTAAEISKQLMDSDAKLIIAHENSLDVAREAAAIKNAAGGKVCQVASIGGDIAAMRADSGNGSLGPTPVEADCTALLPYSSGTTGLPKGVELTHYNLVANALQCEAIDSTFYKSNDVVISPLPMFHIYGFLVSLNVPPHMGIPTITMREFDLERFCQAIEEHKVTRMHIVPPILLGLAKSPLVDKYDMSSLKVGASAAAPLGGELENEVSERFKQLTIKQLWGMSELSPVGTGNPDDNSKPGTVGPPVSNTSAKVICLDSGRALPPGETGELCIKGPQVMKGYLGQPDKTAECLDQEGWLRTGDVAKMDDHGYITITDRQKELIKVLGFQVAPAELESLLLTHPGVLDSCVIPVPNEKAGEVPRAYVVLKPDVDHSEEELMAFVEERVAAYKRLGGGVVFVDAIPKTASGKILRRKVVDLDRSRLE